MYLYQFIDTSRVPQHASTYLWEHDFHVNGLEFNRVFSRIDIYPQVSSNVANSEIPIENGVFKGIIINQFQTRHVPFPHLTTLEGMDHRPWALNMRMAEWQTNNASIQRIHLRHLVECPLFCPHTNADSGREQAIHQRKPQVISKWFPVYPHKAPVEELQTTYLTETNGRSETTNEYEWLNHVHVTVNHVKYC